MEQIFDLTNSLLRLDSDLTRRQLKVRTYVIVALGPQTGVIEFVPNTMPLGEWLLPAHSRYMT